MPPKKKLIVRNPGKPIVMTTKPKPKRKLIVRNPGKPIVMTTKPKPAKKEKKPKEPKIMYPTQVHSIRDGEGGNRGEGWADKHSRTRY